MKRGRHTNMSSSAGIYFAHPGKQMTSVSAGVTSPPSDDGATGCSARVCSDLHFLNAKHVTQHVIRKPREEKLYANQCKVNGLSESDTVFNINVSRYHNVYSYKPICHKLIFNFLAFRRTAMIAKSLTCPEICIKFTSVPTSCLYSPSEDSFNSTQMFLCYLLA